jgi:hypothetical protein
MAEEPRAISAGVPRTHCLGTTFDMIEHRSTKIEQSDGSCQATPASQTTGTEVPVSMTERSAERNRDLFQQVEGVLQASFHPRLDSTPVRGSILSGCAQGVHTVAALPGGSSPRCLENRLAIRGLAKSRRPDSNRGPLHYE